MKERQIPDGNGKAGAYFWLDKVLHSSRKLHEPMRPQPKLAVRKKIRIKSPHLKGNSLALYAMYVRLHFTPLLVSKSNLWILQAIFFFLFIDCCCIHFSKHTVCVSSFLMACCLNLTIQSHYVAAVPGSCWLGLHLGKKPRSEEPLPPRPFPSSSASPVPQMLCLPAEEIKTCACMRVRVC